MNIEKRVALLENRSHVNFAAVSNKAMGLEDGNVKIELSPAHNAIYFASARKSLSECIHFDVFDSKIRDVQGIAFKDGREITGVVDSYTEDPTKVLSAVAIDEFAAHIGELESKVDEAEEKIEDHERRIAHNSTSIGDLDMRISDNTANIVDHETRIMTNTNKIADHEKLINEKTIYSIDKTSGSDNLGIIYTLVEEIPKNIDITVKAGANDYSYILAYSARKIGYGSETRTLEINADIDNSSRLIVARNITEDNEERLSDVERKLDEIFPVNSIVLGARPSVGNWMQICAYGSWEIESEKHIFRVVKTLASMEVSVYFKVPENTTYWLHFNKLTRHCDNPNAHMFDFRFEREDDTVMYGNMSESPRIWTGSWTVNGNNQYTHTYFNVDLNYSDSSKPKVMLHFRFMFHQLYDYETITAETFKNYVNIDGDDSAVNIDESYTGYRRY